MDKSGTGAEVRRDFERKTISSDIPVSVKTLGAAKRIPVLHILDVSLGGIRIQTEVEFKIDDDVDVLMELPSHKLKFVAVVRSVAQGKKSDVVSKDGTLKKSWIIGLAFSTIGFENLKQLIVLAGLK